MKTLPATGLHRESAFNAVKALLEIVIAALFLITFVVQPSRIPSQSMEPTIRAGDFTLLDKHAFAPTGVLDALLPPAEVKRGDLVVFHFPADPTRHLVKRVIALPGDRIRLRQGRVWLNGQSLAEPYAFYSQSPVNVFRDNFPSLRDADPNVDPRWWIELRRTIQDGEIEVPPGTYFMLGDNRNASEDSRYWGFVPREAFVGRPLLVYLASPPAAEMEGALWMRLVELFHAEADSWRVLR